LDLHKIKEYRNEYNILINSKNSDNKRLEHLMEYDHTFIYVNVNYTAGRDYYPLPSYVSAILDIDVYAQVSVNFSNALKKGMNSDGMLLIPSDPTSDSFGDEAENIKNQHAGTVNTGELMVVGYQGQEDNPEYIKFEAHSDDKRLGQIITQTTTSILSTHNVTSPLLVGIKTAGQLGGGTEIKESKELFYNNTIKPAQIKLAKYFNKLLRYMDLEEISFVRIDDANLENASTEQNNKKI
jgi:hypothetical protein